MFDHTCNFRIPAEGQNVEDLELEMIDFGVEEIFADEDGIVMYAPFESFGAIQKELENRNIEILSSGFERIPQVTKELTPEQVADVEKLLEKIEEDDDVMNVYHTMQEAIIKIPKDKDLIRLSFMGPIVRFKILRPTDYIVIDLDSKKSGTTIMGEKLRKRKLNSPNKAK
jgi:hypothetical protein